MDASASTRVVIADPHGAIRGRTARLLEREDDLTVIAVTGDLGTATRLASEGEADVVVLDLSMLGGSSRSAIRDLRRALPGIAVVILTMEAAPAFVPAVLGAGASGYVLKEFAETDLAHAVRQAALGGRFVSEKLTA